MKNFTKLFFIATLVSTHLLGFAANANNSMSVVEGESPTYKGGTTTWKLIQEKGSQLSVSAQNARPAFVRNEDEHTCSKLYASAVSQEFHVVESRGTKSMFATVSLASIAPARTIKQLPSINAYPNPSKGITRLSLNLPGAQENYKIRISNTIGKVLSVHELVPAEKLEVELNMTSLPSGIYFYSLLVNDKTVETKRLVLQR
ncbi:T9SS type A sorting domain-containing protein [uncultured Pontibacter sp.]|uniref:T9SS type A sorting domain-containing protein n=1 Tax=uncultured Pontibacter sp. TaxID=453356 RepID=UPI00260C8BA1|nr:T9SS type A sorting domain-containing protein [uncultured Pontibacter sp.]